MSENAPRDQNNVPTALFQIDGQARGNLMAGQIDEGTGRILVDLGAGGGTVDTVSVATANGFAGTSDGDPTDPTLTLSTTVTGILQGNGTAISAASTTGTGAVVLANSPTFTDDITLGSAAGATGSILFKGTTSGTVTLKTADAAGTWTLTLPTSDGDSGQVLQTDGSGVTTWATNAGGDVVGPASSTDNAIARFDGATGKLLQNSTVTVSDAGGIASTIADTGNSIGLQITQNDTTNNPDAIDIVNSTTSHALHITQTGNVAASSSVGGALLITNTSNTGAGLLVYSNQASSADNLVGIRVDNATFANSGLRIDYDGTGDALTIVATAAASNALSASNTGVDHTINSAYTGSTANKGAANLTSTNVAGSTFQVSGVETALGTVKVTHTANGSDSDASALSLSLLGTNTVAQGIFLDTSASYVTTGKLLNLRVNGTDQLVLTGAGDLTVNTSVSPTTNDGATLGTTSLQWSDLFLAEGGVINFDNGDLTLTQSGNSLTLAGGDLVLAENTSVQLDPALSADGTYTGVTITGTAGAALAFGDVIYLAAADSRWELADASAASTSGSVLVGICVLAAAGDGSATTILLQGNIRADAAFPALTISAPVYISETAGDVTNTAPTTTDSVTRVLGFGLTADSMYFNPSGDYITHV